MFFQFFKLSFNSDGSTKQIANPSQELMDAWLRYHQIPNPPQEISNLISKFLGAS